MKISFFKSLAAVPEAVSVNQILSDIRRGVYKKQINEIRSAIAAGDKLKSDKSKQQLSAVTFSGLFGDRRVLDNLIQYNAIICLDYDKLKVEELQSLILKVNGDAHTSASFISPSGTGLKVLVLVDSGQDDHTSAFQQVSDYYERITGHQSDPSVKDITRLCYVSYDPDLYHNPESKVFAVAIPEADPIVPTTKMVGSPVDLDADFEELFNIQVEFTEKQCTFQEGSRNVFVHQLACNCNRVGIPQGDSLSLIERDFGYDLNEVRSTVNSAYQGNLHEHNTVDTALFTNGSTPSTTDSGQFSDLPLVLEGLVPKLPDLMRKWVQAFDDPIDQDLTGLSFLKLIGAIADKPHTVYGKKKVYAPSYLFVVATQASGKGTLNHVYDLGELLQEKQEVAIDMQRQRFMSACAQCKIDPNCVFPPEPPIQKLIFLPGNSSSMALMESLQDNGGCGFIYESEADTIVETMRQDWGKIDDILRKCYPHEPVTARRSTDNKTIKIKSPKLSLLLAGTPGQVKRLLHSVENGLVSRFLFYCFESDFVFDDQFDDSDDDMGSFKETVATELLDFQYKVNAYPFKLILSLDQRNNFTAHYQSITAELKRSNARVMKSILHRIAVSQLKILLSLSAMRRFSVGDNGPVWSCHQDDFDVSLTMLDRLFEHTRVAVKLIDTKLESGLSRKDRFLQRLPAEFTTVNAEAIGKTMDIAPRTARQYLGKGINENVLQRIKLGEYKRLDVANTTSVSGTPNGTQSADLNSIVKPIKN